MKKIVNELFPAFILTMFLVTACFLLMKPEREAKEASEPSNGIIRMVLEETSSVIEEQKIENLDTEEIPENREEKVQEEVVSQYTPEDLRFHGVIYWGNYKFTWYSEKVLPGGGLNIPGRWSDGNFVRDIDNYICVASSDLPKGTIVDTPWGIAKVYDCGCSSGVIDIYVSW